MSLLRRVIGGVLRRLRTRQGRTLREVAGAAGVSVPYLSEIERGRKEASSEVLAAICRALGIRLSDLLEEARDELRRVEPRTPVAPPRVPTSRVPTSRRVLPASLRPTPAASRPAPVTRPVPGGPTSPTNRAPIARATVGRRAGVAGRQVGVGRRRVGAGGRHLVVGGRHASVGGAGSSVGVVRIGQGALGDHRVLLAVGPAPRC
ncbi:Helix-turn-helix domain-containing protein [Micromonospora pallida]|uniref:Helix-turn-helix domain-containing protein n=1 Tax=Micromonospora pallida TaxID=145854 RepID=A0A1C6T5H2_9ACTN|nr:helix-turn-helix transcriptional regulator [Micromonospora pallida]SCL36783.1 Helix-turn-helix domain-containing protein [Micromonospora pallida]